MGDSHEPEPTSDASHASDGDTSSRSEGDDTQSLDTPLLFGRYQLIEQIGQGGMGTVHKAYDTRLDRTIALKFPKVDSDFALKQRFLREARAAANLDHPNLCRVFDADEINGRMFLTMPFVDGIPLNNYISTPPKLRIHATVKLVHKIAVAMHSAHKLNIVHRDLKPANILIRDHREPIVVDFGLARRLNRDGRLTESGMILGTVAYMSPEQVRGRPDEIVASTDIYSLGVILYELLTGTLPFTGTLEQRLADILFEQPSLPSMERPEISSVLESICLKAMSKSVEDRFTSMAEFALALKRYMIGSSSDVGIQSDTPLRPLPSERPVDFVAEVNVQPTTRRLPGPDRLTSHNSVSESQPQPRQINVVQELLGDWLEGPAFWLLWAAFAGFLLVVFNVAAVLGQIGFVLSNPPPPIGMVNSVLSMLVSVVGIAAGGIGMSIMRESFNQAKLLLSLTTACSIALTIECTVAISLFVFDPSFVVATPFDRFADEGDSQLSQLQSRLAIGQLAGWLFARATTLCGNLAFLYTLNKAGFAVPKFLRLRERFRFYTNE